MARNSPNGAAVLCFVSKEGCYPLLQTQMVNATPYKNPDPYLLKVQNPHFRKVGSVSFIRAPQLSSMFQKEDCYPLLKTKPIYAEPYENSEDYRLGVSNRHFRKVGAAISPWAPQLSGWFSKEDCYHLMKTRLINAASRQN